MKEEQGRYLAYMRVSKSDGSMTIENQRFVIEQWAKKNNITIHEWYSDEISGTTPIAERKELPILINKLQPNDTIVVAEISRLHRTMIGLEQIYRYVIEGNVDKYGNVIEGGGADIITLSEKEQILNTKANKENPLELGMKKIIMSLLFTFSEMERSNISRRTKIALEERKAEGVELGRPKACMPKNFKEKYLRACDTANNYTHTQAMKDLGLKKTTYYKFANMLKNQR